MGDLSKNFDSNEFACPCCGKKDVSPQLVTALQDMRSQAGAPIIITSGYRCPAHNRAVGGSPGSRHLDGIAADIHVVGLSVKEMYELARYIPAFRRGGIGVYPQNHFIHVDCRGYRARWGWIDGKMVPVKEALRYEEAG